MLCRRGFFRIGDVEVTGIQYKEDGSELSSTFMVKVIAVDTPNETLAVMIGNERRLDFQSYLTKGSNDEADSRLLAWYQDHEGQTAISIDAHQERRVLARLGVNGPVLDAATFEGFKLYGGSSTWAKVVDVLEDGTYVMKMGLMVDHFPPNLEVHFRVFLTGVTLDDGSLNRILTKADFNEKNEYEITLLKTPEASKTAACHHIDVYQNGTKKGRSILLLKNRRKYVSTQKIWS